jgi:hypothetical protein
MIRCLPPVPLLLADVPLSGHYPVSVSLARTTVIAPKSDQQDAKQ